MRITRKRQIAGQLLSSIVLLWMVVSVVSPCVCGMPQKLTAETEKCVNTSFPDEDQCCGDQATEATSHHTENSATPYHCEHSLSHLGDGLTTSDNDISNTHELSIDSFTWIDTAFEIEVSTANYPSLISNLIADEPAFHGRSLPLLS